MRYMISLLLVLSSFLMISCSDVAKTPSVPETPNLPQTVNDLDNSGVLFSGTMEIDLESQQIITYENRHSDYVYNITGFLPDKCPGGCFRFRIVGMVGSVLEIELTIENPINLQVYDVRLQYLDTYGKTVVNPDSYTDFLSAPGVNKYPFTAFAKEYPGRAFPVGPGGIDTETLFLDFPPGAPAAVSYAITCSLGGNTQEPYEINGMNQNGMLYPDGGLATISCNILDHQNNVTLVNLQSQVLTGDVQPMAQDPLNPDVWSVVISNTEGAPVGDYMLLIRSYSPNPQYICTYNYVEASVSPHITGGLVVYQSSGGIYSCKPDFTDVTYLGPGYMPVISQDNSTIAYCSGYSGNIRAMNADGTDDHLVASGSYKYPTISADGSVVAFYDTASPTSCFRADIDGSNFVQISPDDDSNWRYAQISGDGSTIAFFRYTSPYAIYLCDSDGSNVRELHQPGYGSMPSITYDANWVFYHTPFQIRRIRTDGTGDERVIGCSATSRYAINPAGTWVSYTQYWYDDPIPGSGNDLMSYDIVNGIERRLTDTYQNAGNKAVTVDGEWVITDGFATGFMYSIKTDGSGSLINWGGGDDPSCHGSIGEHY